MNWALCCWAAFCSAISTRSLYWPNPWWWLAQFKGYASERDSQSSTALSSPKPTAFHAYLIRYLHLFILISTAPFSIIIHFLEMHTKGFTLCQTAQFHQPKISNGHHFLHHFISGSYIFFLNDFYYLVFWLPFFFEMKDVGDRSVDVDGAAGHKSGLSSKRPNDPQVPHGGLFFPSQPSL